MLSYLSCSRRSFLRGITAAGVGAGGIFQLHDSHDAPQRQQQPKTSVGDFLRRPDGEIYYEVAGTGPAIIFAHGFSGNHLSWWQQVPAFSDHYTCVTFSHRGFFPSKEAPGGPGPAAFVDDLAALVDHLGLSEVSLVGQSMGGYSCLPYALRSPKRVRALVMASTTGGVDIGSIQHPQMEDLTAWRHRTEQTRAELRKQGVHPAAGATMAREQPALHYLYGQIEALTSPAYRYAVLPKLLATKVAPEALRQLRVPVLFIHGDEDIVFPTGAAAAMASLVPRAKVERIPKAGHSVYFERAVAFNRLVASFFNSL